MYRKKLFLIGSCVALFIVATCLESCTKVDQPHVDFTINISDPTYIGLSVKGGYIYINGAIVVQTSTGAYISVSQTCTHDGAKVIYEAGKNDFFCQTDYSTYTSSGACNGGPANKNLKSYNTSLSGNNLHVWG
jgi:Rieske Fe-S protein